MRKLSCICSLFLLIAISVAVSVTPVQKVSAFGGGAGSSVSPYLISTCAELFAIDDTTANLSASYVFTSNVDCSVGAEAPMPASGSTYFSGSLDGNNYELRGLNITCTSGTYCALFSQVTGNVVIRISPFRPLSLIVRPSHWLTLQCLLEMPVLAQLPR